MNELIDDLSFSGIVSRLQGDKELGKKMLIEIALEAEKNKEEKAILQKKLQKCINESGIYGAGVKNIMNHLKLESPLTIIGDNEVIVITNGEIKIEKNVI